MNKTNCELRSPKHNPATVATERATRSSQSFEEPTEQGLQRNPYKELFTRLDWGDIYTPWDWNGFDIEHAPQGLSTERIDLTSETTATQRPA
jgi:hypothetical protein